MRLDDCVKVINSGFAKIKKEDVKSIGDIPVISQEVTEYIGFSDKKDGYVSFDNLPILLFGDHNLSIKYIDKPFFVGADGCKLLKPISSIDAKYLYYYLSSSFFVKDVKSKMSGEFYTRHWSYAKQIEIPIPSISTQQEIVNSLDMQIEYITRTELLIEKQQNKVKRVINKIWQNQLSLIKSNSDIAANKSIFDTIISQASKPLK